MTPASLDIQASEILPSQSPYTASRSTKIMAPMPAWTLFMSNAENLISLTSLRLRYIPGKRKRIYIFK